ncbi:DUF1129 family protein [Ligilactobacillus cholophilus]|uniref:DUF1129 family protein n=1 Tax=Ligilactobacillus cholophilus TaxID=3050131 RepID=UPI0025AF09E3|nr:DUF1129 family protein [Ligilactobacillus cholophilus]
MSEDIRQKNQAAARKQAEVREKERQEKIIEINNHFSDLTKRNAEYMIKLTKALTDLGYDPEKRATALHEVYEELKVKQKQGMTAVKLYGPVSKKADDIINGPKKMKAQQPPKFWEMALDNGLLMFAMFCAMYGILGLFSKTPSADAGWITLFSTAIIAGLGLAGFYKVMGDRKAKHRILRGIGAFLMLLAVWFLAFALIARIPSQINQPLNPIVDFILAAAGFGIRYVLKKKLGIRSN